MITKNETKQIIDDVIAYAQSQVDGQRIKSLETEVTVSGSNIATMRFALNSTTQNQWPEKVSLSVRLLIDGRQARLETDDISPKGIRNVVDNAITAILLLEKEPDLLTLPEPPKIDAYAVVNRFDSSTAELTPAARAKYVQAMIDQATGEQAMIEQAIGKQAGRMQVGDGAVGQTIDSQATSENSRTSGVYASGSWFAAIGNSRGVFAYHEESSAECSVTVERRNSSGWGKAQSIDARKINSGSLAKAASDAAKFSADPIEIAPGKYTVILPPSAVLDLLCFLWHEFAATSHKDKLSSLLGKVGKKILGENITIIDDFTHPLQAGAPFDGEGLPRKVVTLVEKGVLKNLVYGRKSAKFFQVESTGHGLAEPSPEGETPQNIVVLGGNTEIAEMIASTERGILLSRVWYVRLVDPTTVLLTGMTRDGTFLIESGKIKNGLLNLRFNVSVLELLNNVVALSPAVRAAGEESAPAVVPAMKVENFNFTSTTKF